MTAVIGAMLLVTGGTLLGFAAVKRLNERTKTLAALVAALDYLNAEIKYGLTALPDVMKKLDENYPGLFFSRCVKRVTSDAGFGGIWRDAIKDARLPLRPDELQALDELGAVLGRFDADAQESAIRLSRERLLSAYRTAKDEQSSKSGLFGFLGVALGVVTAIILI